MNFIFFLYSDCSIPFPYQFKHRLLTMERVKGVRWVPRSKALYGLRALQIKRDTFWITLDPHLPHVTFVEIAPYPPPPECHILFERPLKNHWFRGYFIITWWKLVENNSVKHWMTLYYLFPNLFQHYNGWVPATLICSRSKSSDLPNTWFVS